jgi:hypothetical protein
MSHHPDLSLDARVEIGGVSFGNDLPIALIAGP